MPRHFGVAPGGERAARNVAISSDAGPSGFSPNAHKARGGGGACIAQTGIAQTGIAQTGIARL
jgi:hypothetical protein